MCGICGIFEYGSGQRVDPELLVRMTRVLAHRGPDDQGCLVRAEMRPFAASALGRDCIRRRGLFDPDAVEGLLHGHWSGRTNAGSRTYALVVFEMWAREFLE